MQASSDEALSRYESLLQKELSQIDQLVSGAYAAMADFELFAAYSLTYFAAVSWSEIHQRLLRPSEPMWEAFLGAEDPTLATLFVDAGTALPRQATVGTIEEYRRWILERIEPRDLAGLDRYGPELSVPVDFDILIERAPRLGLDAATVRGRLHLLRGDV